MTPTTVPTTTEPFVCPLFFCEIDCPYGYIHDPNNCPVCECFTPTTTPAPTISTKTGAQQSSTANSAGTFVAIGVILGVALLALLLVAAVVVHRSRAAALGGVAGDPLASSITPEFANPTYAGIHQNSAAVPFDPQYDDLSPSSTGGYSAVGGVGAGMAAGAGAMGAMGAMGAVTTTTTTTEVSYEVHYESASNYNEP